VSETAAAYGMGGWPFWAVIAGLFVVVMARSHLFYWVGRGVTSGAARLADRAPGAEDDAAPVDPDGLGDADGAPARGAAARARVLRLMRTPTARRGLDLVHRFGPYAVTLDYLTDGVQTAVFVGSGLVRMPYSRFLVASVPGSVAWAFVWGTVGLGAVWAAVRLATASPWGLAAVLLVLAGLVTWLVAHRRARARRAAGRRDAAGRAARADQLV
jgi:membrane protein DedA with SNARE-associated domain